MTDDEKKEVEAMYYLAAQKRAELFENSRESLNDKIDALEQRCQDMDKRLALVEKLLAL